MIIIIIIIIKSITGIIITIIILFLLLLVFTSHYVYCCHLLCHKDRNAVIIFLPANSRSKAVYAALYSASSAVIPKASNSVLYRLFPFI